MKATLRDLAGVGLKLLGVYVFVQVLMGFRWWYGFPTMLAQRPKVDTSFFFAGNLGLCLLRLGVGSYLLFFTDNALSLLFGRESPKTVNGLSADELIGAAFVFAGLLVAIGGLAIGAHMFTLFLITAESGGVKNFLADASLPYVLSAALRLALGISCVIYGVRRLRARGRKEAVPEAAHQ